MFADFRLEGYCEAMADAGLPCDEQYIVYGDLTRRGGCAAAEQLLSLRHRPTAIVAANDLMALGAMSVAQARGMTVGGDLSIAGFDDIPPAENLSLTTLQQPIYDIGRQLSNKLCSLIQGEPVGERHVLLKPKLIVRTSTAPLSEPGHSNS
jgi:DNA-binding LacI/PurR family transcriptional regulator